MKLRALAVFLCVALIAATAVAEVPTQANRFRNDLTRQVRLVWGLNAPLALFAAQVHQESSWNTLAVSPSGAEGIAQFLPATAGWIGRVDTSLRSPDTFNPTWSFRAMARYDQWLHDRLRADTACDRWAMVLAAYNGGLGWVLKDKTMAAANGASRWLWWGQVERFNAGRSERNFRENRAYPQRILMSLAPLYRDAGWGGAACL